ncbi:hypothetical protein M976_02802 [Buttiauxella ferragutiae ATCC 51602]|uniref:Uncharacterized protein n=1 Tax=Buttiauxella ferragutiae ATCC 51602 TaxID=1354252 RepID=A0ABX2W7K5_9ENTR|nr:hypothetical protein M976_02802 [Buttiauxella ferragutiae ATCC 51602]TDN54731.1 hypothetical protein EC843_101785 [Buttiauxella sp. JUb87]
MNGKRSLAIRISLRGESSGRLIDDMNNNEMRDTIRHLFIIKLAELCSNDESI